MGLLSNKVQVADLQPGDHIYTWRGPAYAHHGIYMGGGQVIHYGARPEASKEEEASESIVDKMMAKAKKKVMKTSLWSNSTASIKCWECSSQVKSKSCVSKICVRCFLQGGHLYRYEYGVNPLVQQVKRAGTCAPQQASEVEKVLHRAEYLLSSNIGFGKYHLLKRNCEDFAIYCRLGIVGMGQGLSGQAAPLKKNTGIGQCIEVEKLVEELEAETASEESTSTSHEFDS